jgi:hypothetical protein
MHVDKIDPVRVTYFLLTAERMAVTNAVARRSLVKCPTSLKKFGFCGLLAVIYATKMTMPANIAQLCALFEEVKRICGMHPGTWTNALPLRQGRISFRQTLCLLRHYDTCNFHEVRPSGKVTTRMTFSTWLRTQIAPRTCYIVHIHRHAFFVHVTSNKRKWTIFDQHGLRRKHDLPELMKKGGYGRRLVRGVIQIGDKTIL